MFYVFCYHIKRKNVFCAAAEKKKAVVSVQPFSPGTGAMSVLLLTSPLSRMCIVLLLYSLKDAKKYVFLHNAKYLLYFSLSLRTPGYSQKLAS